MIEGSSRGFIMRLIIIFAYLFLGFMSIAQAENLRLSGAQHWLAIASDKDVDVAIGIARQQYALRDTIRVVTSRNGYFAVIAGPYEGYSIQDIINKHKNMNAEELPKDALLSYGANYIQTHWRPQSPPADAKVAFTLDKPALFSAGKLSVTIKGVKLNADTGYIQVDGKDAQGSFHFDLGKDAPEGEAISVEALMSEDFNRAAVVRLLADADAPQVVITNFTGGAHCCTETTILARPAGSEAWVAIKGATLDGDGGYWFEDVTGNGTQELMNVDNAFLYAFDSYAGSFAPLHISKLSGGHIEDISQDPSMRPRLVQDLAGMEFSAKVQPDLWNSNGFLAAWVASKIRLGQGDAAWAKFIANYDKASTFGPQSCSTGQKVNDCPDDKLEPIAIPKALAQFLSANGYGPLPKAAQAELN